ncbi:MAG: hypothetical protein H6833_13670 [Planctomycetes bacterium]|nr:hypothetical protein [Planctomycetota bacterium]
MFVSCAHVFAWSCITLSSQLASDERWLVFGRDDGVAKLWEVLPADGGRLIERATFGESPWAADLLFRHGDGPVDLVRWQRRMDGVRGHVVELHRLDLKTSASKFLLRARQLHGLGTTGNSCYVQTEQGIRLLDLRTEELRPLERPFRLLRTMGDVWLVRCEDVADGRMLHVFDSTANRIIGSLTLDEGMDEGAVEFLPLVGVSPDHGTLGFVEGIPWDQVPAFGEPAITRTTHLRLFDLTNGRTYMHPLRVRVVGGSGRPVLYLSLNIAFDGQGRVVFSEATEGSSDAADAISNVDWKALERTQPEAFTWRLVAARAPAPEETLRYVPAYLTASVSRTSSELELLAAYLQHAGHPTPFRQERDGRVTWTHVPMTSSSDGRRWLVQLRIDALDADLLFIDLEKDRLVPIRAPKVSVPNLHCIRKS